MNNTSFLNQKTNLLLKIACLSVMALGVVILTHYIFAGGVFALSDFSAFYNAGRMAMSQHAADLYDLQSYQQAYQQTFASDKSGYGWFYPPHFLLPLSLLSELPRVFAKLVWIAATFAIYLFGMSKLISRPSEWVFVLFLPAVSIAD